MEVLVKRLQQLGDLIKGKPEDLIVHVGTNDIANKVKKILFSTM